MTRVRGPVQPARVAGRSGGRSRICTDERGEVLPVAILFWALLVTILIGVHVILVSLATTAVQTAADSGVAAAQAAPTGASACGTLSLSGQNVTPTTERECQGLVAAQRSMDSSGSMVAQSRASVVNVNDDAGVVSVQAFGIVTLPILGVFEVTGRSCGPLDVTESGAASTIDPARC